MKDKKVTLLKVHTFGLLIALLLRDFKVQIKNIYCHFKVTLSHYNIISKNKNFLLNDSIK